VAADEHDVIGDSDWHDPAIENGVAHGGPAAPRAPSSNHAMPVMPLREQEEDRSVFEMQA
jgi:hypothetical protein